MNNNGLTPTQIAIALLLIALIVIAMGHISEINQFLGI